MSEVDPILQAFVDAAVETLRTMAMLELEPGEVTSAAAFDDTLDYTTTMGLCGENEGLLVLSLESDLARKIVASMLGEDESEIDGDLLDGVGELANMIAGSAKTVLGQTDYHFDLSIPAVLNGKDTNVTPQTPTDGLRVACTCEGRSFVLGIWIKGIGDS